jgi:hypothetical protein
MKRFSVILGVALVIFLVFSMGGLEAAEEKATKEECVAKVKQAAKLIKDIGLEAALKKMNDPNGPFVWKDTYVFAFDSETCKMLAHKSPKIVGYMAKDLRDVNGKLYFQEFLHVANTKGEGWVSYVYPKTRGAIPEPKITYIFKVPGEKVILGAGIYE